MQQSGLEIRYYNTYEFNMYYYSPGTPGTGILGAKIMPTGTCMRG